jgi:hypothetical protein
MNLLLSHQGSFTWPERPLAEEVGLLGSLEASTTFLYVSEHSWHRGG